MAKSRSRKTVSVNQHRAARERVRRRLQKTALKQLRQRAKTAAAHKPHVDDSVATIQRALHQAATARNTAAISPAVPQATVGTVVTPPVITVHNYQTQSVIFVNGIERVRVSSDEINRVMLLLTEIQREGAVSISAVNLRTLRTRATWEV